MEAIKRNFKSEVLGNYTIELQDVTNKRFDGDVIVTDPCYFVSDSIWNNFVELLFDENTPKEMNKSGLAVITVEGKTCEFLYTQTAYGYGDFGLQHNSGTLVGRSSIGVDAGMISVALLEDAIYLADDPPELERDYYPKILNFKGEVSLQNSNFVGNITVRTDRYSEEYDDEEEDYFDYDEQ